MDKPTEKEGPSERSVKKNLKAGNDRFGMAIPEAILPAFTSKELKKICTDIRAIRVNIDAHLRSGDIAFAALAQHTLINLDNAMTNIKFSSPHCVCRACRGGGCYRCKDRGFMTLAQYNALPPEFKAEKA